jgi:hypothetical protein
MRPDCGGVVSSLHGHALMLTGKIYINGQHIQRPELRRRLRLAGVKSVLQDGTRNRRVSLLVQGDLSSARVVDAVNVRSKKAVFVDDERARGHHICEVDVDGLNELLEGGTAFCLRTRIVRDAVVELRLPAGFRLGPPLRRRSTPARTPNGLELDLTGLDRGTSAHEDLLEALKAFLPPGALREPSGSGPQFDAGWVDADDPTRLFVVEAKSLTGAREDQQIRLGIGQLLDYWYALREMDLEYRELVPVLVLERAPKDARWHRLTTSLGLALTYAPDFPGLQGTTDTE